MGVSAGAQRVIVCKIPGDVDSSRRLILFSEAWHYPLLYTGKCYSLTRDGEGVIVGMLECNMTLNKDAHVQFWTRYAIYRC